MYQLSRAIYRALAPEIDRDLGRHGHEAVLHACEGCVERLVTQRDSFANPPRTLFNDVRMNFPVQAQPRVWTVIAAYLHVADDLLARHPGGGLVGAAPRCPCLTRRGTPCRREPLPHSGYCPSHQHLAPGDEARQAA